ncbi:hypothetical protein BZA70DRAFT_268604 [Myxozyma melibiosi]|uniref:Transcription factor Iwr1 domain-containing protein n=1 Tax=Myxozyma melibiosi TaxID=54550 RepID=A0ABR1F2Y1_9ASCO
MDPPLLLAQSASLRDSIGPTSLFAGARPLSPGVHIVPPLNPDSLKRKTRTLTTLRDLNNGNDADDDDDDDDDDDGDGDGDDDDDDEDIQNEVYYKPKLDTNGDEDDDYDDDDGYIVDNISSSVVNTQTDSWPINTGHQSRWPRILKALAGKNDEITPDTDMSRHKKSSKHSTHPDSADHPKRRRSSSCMPSNHRSEILLTIPAKQKSTSPSFPPASGFFSTHSPTALNPCSPKQRAARSRRAEPTRLRRSGYPGGWPSMADGEPADGKLTARTLGDDEDIDMMLSSELELDAQVIAPSGSEYFVLEREESERRRSRMTDSDSRRGSANDDEEEAEDEDDEQEDADDDSEYFQDFGSLLKSLSEDSEDLKQSERSSPKFFADTKQCDEEPIRVIERTFQDDAPVEYDYCSLDGDNGEGYQLVKEVIS